jgi:hypothetical protein
MLKLRFRFRRIPFTAMIKPEALRPNYWTKVSIDTLV